MSYMTLKHTHCGGWLDRAIAAQFLTSTFAHFNEQNQLLTQIKSQHHHWLFNGSSIWCYELINNINEFCLHLMT